MSSGKDPVTPEGAPGRSLSDRVASGAAWIVGGRFLVRSLGLINTLILARLLAPADFGLVAIGVTVMQLLENVSDIGVGKTVVRFRDAGRSEYDTLFTISFLRGLIVAAILIAVSFVAGDFYNDERARTVFLGISMAPIFHALVNPRFYEFERDLRFSREFIASGINKVIGVAVSVTVALIFKTYWAIILGLVSGAATQMIISYAMRPYRPRISIGAIKSIGGFTGWLTGVSFMAALNNKLDILILAKIVSPADVGAFFVGGSVASLPSGEIATPISRAVYPGLSALQGDGERMRKAYLRGVEALGFIAMPAAFGFAFLAEDLVALLLGDQWEKAVLMVQYFAPAAGLMVLFSATNSYAMAHGRARLLFVRETLVFLIRMPIFVFASLAYGFQGAVFASAAGLLVITVLNAGLYKRLSGHSVSGLFWLVRRQFAGVAMMAVYFLFLRPQLGAIDSASLIVRLVLDASMGAGLYFATLFSLWRLDHCPDSIEAMVLAKAQPVLARLRRP